MVQRDLPDRPLRLSLLARVCQWLASGRLPISMNQNLLT